VGHHPTHINIIAPGGGLVAFPVFSGARFRGSVRLLKVLVSRFCDATVLLVVVTTLGTQE